MDLKPDEIQHYQPWDGMLLFPLKRLTAVSKGNKIINIPAAKAKSREEVVSHLISLPKVVLQSPCMLVSVFGLKPSDLDNSW